LKDAAAPGEDVALEFSGVDMSAEVMAWCSMTHFAGGEAGREQQNPVSEHGCRTWF
jgi:hypothetical protein